MHIEKIFCSFIKENWKGKKPLLCALSGGPDSTALYHLLKRAAIPFHVAHMNHRWREESDREAAFLREMCFRDGVSYHEECLNDKREYNKEEHAREARFAFFEKLVPLHGCEAVVLGHHGDDQAETVLKRIFEGASLFHLHGLQSVSSFRGLTLWRPLLELKKQEIVAWLESAELPYFIDKTNSDPRFLRTRLRQDIIPYLSEKFGKEITSSLSRLAKSSFELKVFCEEVVATYREKMFYGQDGSVCLDFMQQTPRTHFEWKLVVYDFFLQQQVTLSSHNIDTIIMHLKRKSVYKEIKVGRKKVTIEREILCVRENFNSFPLGQECVHPV